MKTGAHWFVWLLLILAVVLFFPKPCGYKSIIPENQNQTAQLQESQEQTPNATSEEQTPIEEEILPEEEPPLVDEAFLEGEPLPEENFSIYDSDMDSDLYSEKSWTIKSSEIVTESKCFGFKDYLISKITRKLNKNNSTEWCYGICLEKKEKINQTETGNESAPVFLTDMLKDFSKLFIILAIVIILIIVISFIKSVLKKT